MGLQSHLRLDWGRIHFQVHSHGLGRLQFLLGCWTEGFYSLLAVGQFLATLSPVPCCMSWRLLSTWQMTSLRVKVGDGERGHPRQKPWSVHNLISDDKLHFCHILFVISKSLTQPHTQGEGLQSLTGWISAFLTRYKQDFSVLSHGLL